MRTKTYRHLCRAEREVIGRMMQEGKSQAEVAQTLGKSQSTISRELKRNSSSWGYYPDQAERRARKRKKAKPVRRSMITGFVKAEIIRRLHRNQTPELISGAMRAVHHFPSHETIYQFIARDKLAGGDLWKLLPINRKRKYQRRSKVCRRGGLQIPNRVSIEERPEVVNLRQRYGDWEVDLISGYNRSGYILSLYERKSRLGKLYKLESKHSEATALAIIEVLSGYKVRTLTFDNGLEFAQHETVSVALGAKGYFCAPYHSWEKGGVENFNRLVRYYYPKRTCFKAITQTDLDRIEIELNERPRKVLGFNPPIKYKNQLAA